MTREQALELLHAHMQNVNLRRHCYAVEAVMRALARHFKEDEDLWGLAGLLHDADWEETKNHHEDHVHTVVAWLKEKQVDTKIIDAIMAHGWGYVPGCPEPKDAMQWSLYCCDELTGLIVAIALVKGKKLENVTVDSIMKKFPEKNFAAGANREQIQRCEEKLNISLPDFIGIALSAMQEISQDLGLT